MAMKFENPINGYKEDVDGEACFGMFFFGALYLAYRGLWKHVFIWLIIVGIPTFAGGGPAIILVLPIVSLIYTLLIQGILETDYLRRGWKDVTRPLTPGVQLNPGGTKVIKNPGERLDQPKPTTIPEFKKCPFCAEDVRQDAIKCKHCHSEIGPTNVTGGEIAPQK